MNPRLDSYILTPCVCQWPTTTGCPRIYIRCAGQLFMLTALCGTLEQIGDGGYNCLQPLFCFHVNADRLQ